jgi:homocysteine S-methyltransferase
VDQSITGNAKLVNSADNFVIYGQIGFLRRLLKSEDHKAFIMTANNHLTARLNEGEIILLDGGIGTELERLGAPMDHDVWCAAVLETHPHLVKDVHRSYINAGADIITVNTYATTRIALRNANIEEKFGEWNRLAVKLAKEALAECDPGRPVYIAGSVSTFASSSRFGRSWKNGTGELQVWFQEQAKLLVESGVDLLLIETLASESSVMSAAVEAVSDFDVPIWVALSCARDRKTGELSLGVEESSKQSQTFHAYHEPFHLALDKLVTQGGYSGLLVMHSEIDVTEPAIRSLCNQYKGPVGAYPNAGYWQRPEWIFVDQISPGDYAEKARTWVDEGAQIIGGCCGIGPEHIRALARQLRPG